MLQKEKRIHLSLIALCSLLLFVSSMFKAPDIEPIEDIDVERKDTVNTSSEDIVFPKTPKEITIKHYNNTVEFNNNTNADIVFTITQPVSKEKVIWEESIAEKDEAIHLANRLLTQKSKGYKNERRGEVYTFMDKDNKFSKTGELYFIKETSDSIKLVKQQHKMLYFTDPIKPGSKTVWKVSDSLSKSSDININIAAFKDGTMIDSVDRPSKVIWEVE